MIEQFFTTEQVANILQVHPFTILKFIKEGKLPGVKLGRVYRIKESEVARFLEERSVASGTRRQDVIVSLARPEPVEGNHDRPTTAMSPNSPKNSEGKQYYTI